MHINQISNKMDLGMKRLYKVVNADMKSKFKKMQLKVGLNVNIEKFNPAGSCTRGGIYFCEIDEILRYVFDSWYGTHLCEVFLPEGETIYKDVHFEYCTPVVKYKAHRVILSEPELITIETVQRLVQEGAKLFTPILIPERFASVLFGVPSTFGITAEKLFWFLIVERWCNGDGEDDAVINEAVENLMRMNLTETEISNLIAIGVMTRCSAYLEKLYEDKIKDYCFFRLF